MTKDDELVKIVKKNSNNDKSLFQHELGAEMEVPTPLQTELIEKLK